MSEPENAKVSSLWKGKRFYIAVLLFFNLFINYIDRINLSVAAPAIVKDFNWDPAMMGIVFSAFLWTYVLCLVPIGWLVDKVGTRKVNAISVGVWVGGRDADRSRYQSGRHDGGKICIRSGGGGFLADRRQGH